MTDPKRDITKMTFAEVMDCLGEVIRLQSEAIDDLYRVLLIYLYADDIAKLPAWEKMLQAVGLKKRLEV